MKDDVMTFVEKLTEVCELVNRKIDYLSVKLCEVEGRLITLEQAARKEQEALEALVV
jgi:nitrate reductase NapAB chaperone NapD